MNSPAFDLEPAASALEALVSGISDDQLDTVTPCGETTVHLLLAHVIGFTEAFRKAATKEMIGRAQLPNALAPDLGLGEWRTVIPAQLEALVTAWREPAAWEGETQVGGVELSASQSAVFALDELIIHGWDLARATSQSFVPDSNDLNILLSMLRDTPVEGTPGLFGPVVPVPDNAPLFDRVLGLTGRDPDWSAHREGSLA
ncbi:TIGR03086 family metal-binding protein [Nocardia jejuensis]|uniref:TIGR03086 family metal-binding protein n=1 Tax=Nocardia jejuensis TaxID=328049 RepID=UPI00082EB5F0|nr:TIGR03086 family metal-binding protein [Nocardia jejuensis]